MANRYWVGGTGTWSTSNTTNWSTSSGGSGGASVPGTSDAVIFDGSSGSGTVTVNYTPTVVSLTMNLFTGTFSCTAISLNGTGTVFQGGTGYTNTSGTTVTITSTGAIAITVSPGATTEANSISFAFTGGFYNLTFLNTSGHAAKNVDFTGWSGPWLARSNSNTIYGNFTLSTGMTFTSSTGVITFGATSGTQNITTNGKTFNAPITVNGSGGTVKLLDALTMGTKALTLTNGTFDGNNKTISGSSNINSTAGTLTVKNISTAQTFNHNAGNITLGGNCTVSGYTFSAGSLNLAGFTYTITSFNHGGTCTLTFNGGTISNSGNWGSASTLTTVAGTGTGKISMTGPSANFTTGGATFNCTLSSDGSSGSAVYINDSNTFTTIANGTNGVYFNFAGGTTTTVTNWNVNGVSGSKTNVQSSSAGTSFGLSKSSGTVSSDYLNIYDSTATGGATWYAGANSTDGGGNTGWIFSGVPQPSGFFLMFN
jgi:hypothetical protein